MIDVYESIFGQIKLSTETSKTLCEVWGDSIKPVRTNYNTMNSHKESIDSMFDKKIQKAKEDMCCMFMIAVIVFIISI